MRLLASAMVIPLAQRIAFFGSSARKKKFEQDAARKKSLSKMSRMARLLYEKIPARDNLGRAKRVYCYQTPTMHFILRFARACLFHIGAGAPV